MHKCIIAILLLSLIAPAAAKDYKAPGSGKGGKGKGNHALGINLVTGECQVRKLGFQAQPPVGFRLISLYESKGSAEAAKLSVPECKAHPAKTAKNDAEVRAEEDCRTRASKHGSSLLDLFSGETKNSVFLECMSRYGYDIRY